MCGFEGEDEGWLFGLVWLGLTVELTIARRVRSLDDTDQAGA